jgi:hypothetical protein
MIVLAILTASAIDVTGKLLSHGRKDDQSQRALSNGDNALHYLSQDLRGSVDPDNVLVAISPTKLELCAEANESHAGPEHVVYQAGSAQPGAAPDGSLTRTVLADGTCAPGGGASVLTTQQLLQAQPAGSHVENPSFSFREMPGDGSCVERSAAAPPGLDRRAGDPATTTRLARITAIVVRMTSYASRVSETGTSSASTTLAIRNRLTQTYLQDSAGCTDDQF